MGIFRAFIAVSLLCLLAVPAARAQALTGTLKEIKERGSITVGHREFSSPLSYVDEFKQPIGYHVDVCKRIVDAVKGYLGMANLNTYWQPTTAQNRFSLVTDGTVDIECGASSNNVARQKQVAFGYTTFVTRVRMAVKKGSGIKGFDDLRGQTVATVAGTTSVEAIHARKKAGKLDFTETQAQSGADMIRLLDTGTAAFIMDDNDLASQIAIAKNPDAYEIVGEPLSIEPIAVMFRRDDPQFKSLVDKAIAGLMNSGELTEIYTKWFESPIPPRMVNLRLPMSGQLKRFIQIPNALPAETYNATKTY